VGETPLHSDRDYLTGRFKGEHPHRTECNISTTNHAKYFIYESRISRGLCGRDTRQQSRSWTSIAPTPAALFGAPTYVRPHRNGAGSVRGATRRDNCTKPDERRSPPSVGRSVCPSVRPPSIVNYHHKCPTFIDAGGHSSDAWTSRWPVPGADQPAGGPRPGVKARLKLRGHHNHRHRHRNDTI